MVKSMTGYGRSRETLHQRDITVEVRSVNNRFLDCTVKMPRAYVFAEDAVKTRVRSAVSRGKVDVFVTIDSSAADVSVPAGVSFFLPPLALDSLPTVAALTRPYSYRTSSMTSLGIK